MATISISITIDDKFYHLIQKETQRFGGSIEDYLYSLVNHSMQIVPNVIEHKKWRDRLINMLNILSEYYAETQPIETDSLSDLLEKYFWWVDNRNDGYFYAMSSEPKDDDRFDRWLLYKYFSNKEM